MSLNTTKQIELTLKDKKNILVIFDKNSKGDGIGSALALLLFLESMGKNADIVSPGLVLPKSFKFLKRSKNIKPEIGHLQKFILTIDVAKQGVKELSYDTKEDSLLRVYVTPKQGYITKDNIKTAQSDFKYDLIFVIDTADQDSLGDTYNDNTGFFNKTPIINIDHKSDNEQFGSINLIDITASTTAEIVFSLLNDMKPEMIDRQIANSLLTGIIADTKSFTTNNVKPQTFSTASELIKLGADRNFIVRNLQQNKTISTFKLWGQALSQLQCDPEHNIVWTIITHEDFKRSGASKEDLPEIIDELISNSPSADIIAVLYEDDDPDRLGHTYALVKIIPHYHATEMMKGFDAKGDHETTSFTMKNTTLKEAEKKVIDHIKQEIKKSR